jgi:hypothetical protein
MIEEAQASTNSKINRRPARQHPAYGKTQLTPIPKVRPKKGQAKKRASRSE